MNLAMPIRYFCQRPAQTVPAGLFRILQSLREGDGGELFFAPCQVRQLYVVASVRR